MNEIRFAFRLLLKSPGFTAVAVLSLGLGIGATTTVFAWIQSVLLRPIPGVGRPEQLVVLTTTFGKTQWDTLSLPDLRDYAGLTNTFAGIVGSQITPACLSVGGQPQWVYGQIATANFFDALGVKPILGRTFVAEEDLRPGGAPVLVLSEGFWRRRFGGDPAIVGRAVELNRHSFTIVGVVPSAFRGTMSGLMCDFWAPLVMHEQVANFGSLENRGDHWLHTQARLQPGVSRATAQTAVDTLARQLEQAYPASNREIGVRVLPVWKAPYGGQAMLLPVLSLLLAVSFGVLLIVAANVANLLLARATGRQKEVAIRLALGAGRARLVRQLLLESLLLALLGGLVGILGASWGTQLFESFLPTTYLPIGYSFSLDLQTLSFTLALTLATGLVFGLAPAWRASAVDLHSTLKEGGRTSGGAVPHHRLRSVLVAGEVALALMLLLGAGLCIKGFDRARQIDLGFDPSQVLVGGLRIGMNGYDEARGLVFYRNLRERLAAVPGVEVAALSGWLPLGFEGGSSMGVQVEGYDRKPNEDTSIPYSIVSPGYFDLLRIPLLAGRDFTERDDTNTARVVIVNETMAKRFWPGQSPLGRKLRYWGDQREATVVGVVKAGKYRTLNEPPRDFMYLAYQQGVWDLNLGVGLRVAGNPLAFASSLRQAIRSLDPGVEVWALLAMQDYIQAAFLAQRITATLLMALGGVALVLAAMGIYGVMAYIVSQRTHELGIRVALGARSPDLLRLVVGEGMRLAAWGMVVGLAGAVGLTRLLANFLYGVSPFDPAAYLAVAATLAGVALVACYLPARRATRVDPMVALRCE
ncbi:MAG: ABC transporter permease [Verrucomicrobia bacterium]|nr:ABC transporter permease [Verrucomicrobiota bacterium]